MQHRTVHRNRGGFKSGFGFEPGGFGIRFKKKWGGFGFGFKTRGRIWIWIRGARICTSLVPSLPASHWQVCSLQCHVAFFFQILLMISCQRHCLIHVWIYPDLCYCYKYSSSIAATIGFHVRLMSTSLPAEPDPIVYGNVLFNQGNRFVKTIRIIQGSNLTIFRLSGKGKI